MSEVKLKIVRIKNKTEKPKKYFDHIWFLTHTFLGTRINVLRKQGFFVSCTNMVNLI